ncbi:MAG: hypothetical protein ACYTKC_05520 [Planctomycetota bacterium]|jgi:hypothetical protein
MVHRLTQNRLFMVALAALVLLAFMPWQGALHCQKGSVTADGSCCCTGEAAAATTGACCNAPDSEDPTVPSLPAPNVPDPCACIQVALPAGLPAVAALQGEEEAGMFPNPAAGEPAADNPAAGIMRVLQPQARTGPPRYLRLQVLLI